MRKSARSATGGGDAKQIGSTERAMGGSVAGDGGGSGIAPVAPGSTPERATVPAAPPVAVADAPDGDVEPALWPDVLGVIRSQKPALAAFLNDAVASTGEGAVLKLAVPNGSRFHKDQLKDRGNMRLMERAAGEVFGGRVRLTFTFGEAPQERSSSHHAEVQISEETAQDPVVRKVLDMFGGEIRGSRREE